MIRILRKLHVTNATQYTKCTSIRLYSNKSDDSCVAVDELLEENSDKNSTKNFNATSFGPENGFYSKSLQTDSSASVIELLETLPEQSDSITLEDLFALYDRIKANYVFTYNAIKHPKFRVLRDATETHLPQFNTKQIKSIFTAILSSKPIMTDKLGKMIAEALIKRASYLPFDQILFLDFILHKYYRVSELSKDYNIIRLTLQTMFLSKVEDELDGSKSFEEIMKFVAFCENNAEIVPMKIVNSLTTSLLLFDEEYFNIQEIMSVLLFLSNFGKLNEHAEKLLRKMIDLWHQQPVTARNVMVLFKVLANKCDTIDKEIFQETEFIRHCINIVIEQDERMYAFSVQNSLNKMGFVSVELIDHLSKNFETPEQIRQLNIRDYIIFCTACAKADYKPSNWEENILGALKTFNFSIYLTGVGSFDWAQFVLRLDQLGYCNIRLIRNILNSTYLQKQKWFDHSKVDKLQEILEREDATFSGTDSEWSSNEDTCDELPLHDDLMEMFGATKLWSNVSIDKTVTVPYLLKMDLHTGNFIPFTKEPSLRHITVDELPIGIIVVSDEDDQRSNRNKLNFAKKQCHRLERKGVASIIIEESKWNTLKAYEKSLVFYTKIVNMMEAFRKKKLSEIGKHV